jgi:hypothetical protein
LSLHVVVGILAVRVLTFSRPQPGQAPVSTARSLGDQLVDMAALRSSSSERQPLLDGPVDTYTATSDGPGNHGAPKKQPFQISGKDLAWVLAGLWSAVFLGALDGTRLTFLEAIQLANSLNYYRDYCSYTTNGRENSTLPLKVILIVISYSLLDHISKNQIKPPTLALRELLASSKQIVFVT